MGSFKCPNCNSELNWSYQICESCGTPYCSNCGSTNTSTDDLYVCPRCRYAGFRTVQRNDWGNYRE